MEIFGTLIISLVDGFYSAVYVNNRMTEFGQEQIAAIVSPNNFEGTFTSAWQEGKNLLTADLLILLQNGVYILTWNAIQQNGSSINTQFTGRGLIRNGELVCSYRMT
jgi:hypothetical protein